MRPLAKDDPRQIGPFRVIGLLGGGGMGRVYLGRGADGRTVAVKTARSELADDQGFRTRFAREVAAAQRVGGPFVAPVVDSAPHDDVPWMATEYVPGVSLTAAVQEHGPLPEDAVRLLTAGLLHALAAVHAHGLVHRDLKPSNILLTAGGPRVIDFGIARSAADTALTMTGTALGTPGFMAPEQLVMQGAETTGAADVFALGGVLVFAATGSGPFGTAEPQVLMYRTVHERPRLDGLPADLADLAAACLAKEPGHRPGLPALTARIGAPGPYGDWLPEAVAGQLHRLSARLGDPRSPEGSVPTPPAGSPAADRLPDRTVPGPVPPTLPATPPPGAHGPGPGAPPQERYTTGPPPGPSGVSPVPPPHPPAAPGPGRRRVLAALSGLGVAAGGGALGWALWPDGGADGGARAGTGTGKGNTPSGSRQPSGGPRSGGGPSPAGAPSDRLPREIRDRGVVIVGSDLTYPPMEFTEGGEAVGVDVDLGHALGRRLGVPFRFENAVFDSLLAGLDAGRYDLVMSAMTDTRDRQEGKADGRKTGSGVDMIDYFRAGLALVVRKGNPEGIGGTGDLAGRTVAVQRGTVAAFYLDELAGKSRAKWTLRELSTPAEVHEDVVRGRSAACLHDFPVAAHTAATHSGGDALELSGGQIDPEPFGIAVARNGTVLRDAVREALAGLLSSGEYTRILRKWHVEDGGVRRVVLNGGR
ncbi:transporter substrate-binding domain-containing protein [Streptomyces sp. NPDC018031]|uniref:protein kinase domain-containing protein n=1 Tax=Streptomyces sp. NPDC018031 TaxID=3365033 RepID=UPI00379CE4CA